MRGVTLRHPWPFAVCFLGKQIENRDWDDRLADLMGLSRLIGEQVAIHGGAAPIRPKRRTVSEHNPWREFTSDLGYIRDVILDGELPDAAAQHLARTCPGPLTPEAFILPGVVAVATISGTTRASRDRWAAQGQLHILLSDVVTLPEPVTCPGAQGFWELPPVVEAAVRRQVERVQVGRPAVASERTGAEWLGL